MLEQPRNLTPQDRDVIHLGFGMWLSRMAWQLHVDASTIRSILAGEPATEKAAGTPPAGEARPVSPAPITEAPKPLPANSDEDQRPAEAKTSDQEPSESEGSAGMQDRCESIPAPITPETANELPSGDPANAGGENERQVERDPVTHGAGLIAEVAAHGNIENLKRGGASERASVSAVEPGASSKGSGKSAGPKGSAAPTLKDRVRALYADHPDWTSGQFADALPDANYDSVVTTVTTVRKEARQPKVEQPAKPATKTDLIRALHAEHPEMTAREAAKHLGMEIYPLRELTRQAGLAWAPADHRGRPLKVEAERPRATPLVPAPSSAPTGRSSPSAVIVKPMVKPRGTRFHLRNDDGEYLHFSCEAMTAAKAHAWIGDENHLRAVRRKFDLARDLREVAVPKEQAAA